MLLIIQKLDKIDIGILRGTRDLISLYERSEPIIRHDVDAKASKVSMTVLPDETHR